MSNIDKVFSGSIPEIYDTYLVPLIFLDYAEDMANKVAVSNPAHVLETAAGSGVVTRALAPKLSADAKYTVSDLNQPMLDRAAAMQHDAGRISWQQADAMELPFADDAFDIVCCQFGVMFFPNHVDGFKEALRVLKPGGKFIFNVWDKIEENDFAHIVTGAAVSVFPNDPPVFLARTPHGYHDTALIHDDLAMAGFSNIELETTTETSTAPSARDAAIAYCQGTPLRMELEALDASRLEEVTDIATQAIERQYGNGPVSGKIRAHTFSASS
ncbi:MAG: class I SAM-dependent methyltransferase [Hyphomicrobiales bacterium]